MKKIKNILVASAVTAFGVAATNSALAADKGLYIVPSVGYQYFDSDRPSGSSGGSGYDEELTYGFGVGYQINPRLAVELATNITDNAESKAAGNPFDADFYNVSLDALVSIPELKFWRMEPYAVIGAGHQRIDYDYRAGAPGATLLAEGVGDDDGTIINAGLGVHVDLIDNLKLRVDARSVYNTDIETFDTQANLGLNWLIWPAAKAAAPAPKPAPVVDGDDDNDGVLNSRDKCPNTKAGAKVDAKGCYLDLMETKTFTMDVNFNVDSANLREESVAEIQELAAFMKQYPKANVVLEGHTDSTGSATYNQKLSERRAVAVGAALVEKFGVNSSRISTVGYGESRPVASNATKEGRAQNRRTVGNVQATVNVK